MLSSWETWAGFLTVTGHKLPFRWLQTKRKSPGKHGSSSRVNSLLAVNEVLILVVTCQVVDTVVNPVSKFELTIRQGVRDGQDDELVARLLALLRSSGDQRFHELVRIHIVSPDMAGGVHVGKDDLDVGAGDQRILFGYASDENGETDGFMMVRCS